MGKHAFGSGQRKPTKLSVAGVVGLVVFSGAVVIGATSGTAAAAPQGLVIDSFSRMETSGWGQADSGGSYALTTVGSGASASVNGSAGLLGPISVGRSVTATLPAVKVTDIQVQSAVTLPASLTSGASVFHGVLARTQSNGSTYRGKVQVSAAGNVGLSLSRTNANVESNLAFGPSGIHSKPGTKVHVQLMVVGSSPVTLSVRTWLDGATVPGWQLEYSDASGARIVAAGAVGLWDYVSGGSSPVKVLIDDLSAELVTTAPVTSSTSSTKTTTVVSTTAVAPTTTKLSTTPVAPAPTTSTAAPPPVSNGSRGSAAVGSTTYAVPSGALFVSPSGNDASAGTSGAPLLTVSAAVAKATAGQTIVLRGGIYHEFVRITKSNLTIQAYPNEAVWFDGSSSVSGWTKAGSVWVHNGWSTRFDASASFSTGTNYPGMVTAAHPMAAHPDEVFVGGIQLSQVGSASQVAKGTFAVDYAAKTITIGTDPASGEVRASDLEKAFTVIGSHVTLQGLGVRRFATPVPMMGSINSGGSGNTFRNIFWSSNATLGISIGGAGNTLDHVTVGSSGLLGIHGNYADNVTIENSIITNNNLERFNPTPTSSGIKLTKSRNIRIANNTISNNLASGFWCDQSCYNMTIVNNAANSNLTAGIETEISDTGIVAGNTATGNLQGIYVLDTGNLKIFNNALGGNCLQDLAMIQDARRQARPTGGQNDPRYPVPDPNDPWLVRNNKVANNVFGSGGYFQVYVLDKETKTPADSMNISVQGNLFNARVTTVNPALIAWGGDANVIQSRFDTVAAMKAKNTSWINAQTSISKPLESMSGDIAADIGVAVPLPGDVASTLGQAFGVKRIGPFV